MEFLKPTSNTSWDTMNHIVKTWEPLLGRLQGRVENLMRGLASLDGEPTLVIDFQYKHDRYRVFPDLSAVLVNEGPRRAMSLRPNMHSIEFLRSLLEAKEEPCPQPMPAPGPRLIPWLVQKMKEPYREDRWTLARCLQAAMGHIQGESAFPWFKDAGQFRDVLNEQGFSRSAEKTQWVLDILDEEWNNEEAMRRIRAWMLQSILDDDDTLSYIQDNMHLGGVNRDALHDVQSSINNALEKLQSAEEELNAAYSHSEDLEP